MIDRRYLLYFDWFSLTLICLLAGIGLLFVFSASHQPHMLYSIYFKKQLLGVVSGICLYFLCSIIDYRSFLRWGYFLYFATIALLIFTLIKGSIGMGAQRWINLGIIKFQPSEIAKLFCPSFLTYYFFTEKNSAPTSKTFGLLISILSFSTFLILKQPDLGTAIIIFLSSFLLLWLAGLPNKILMLFIFICFVSTPLLWKYMHPYQKQRIAVFFGEGEVHKERYQIEQSKIAVGSGGFYGKGLLKGTQNQLMFLPESRTDFIFSVVCEEWGFLGALGLMLLFALLFLRSFFLIVSYKNIHVQLLAIGLIMPILFSTIINIAMVLDLLPIVGIPLPLVSYGITNLWVTFASLGFMNSIAMRRFTHSS